MKLESSVVRWVAGVDRAGGAECVPVRSVLAPSRTCSCLRRRRAEVPQRHRLRRPASHRGPRRAALVCKSIAAAREYRAMRSAGRVLLAQYRTRFDAEALKIWLWTPSIWFSIQCDA